MRTSSLEHQGGGQGSDVVIADEVISRATSTVAW